MRGAKDDRLPGGEGGHGRHRGHDVRAGVHVDLRAAQRGWENRDRVVLPFYGSAHAGQDFEHEAVALGRLAVQSGNTHRSLAHGPCGQKVGGIGPVAFHAHGPGPVGSGVDDEADVRGGNPRSLGVGAGLPNVQGSALQDYGHAESGHGVQRQRDIGPGGHGRANQPDGRCPAGQGGGQEQAREVLAALFQVDGHLAAAKAGAGHYQRRVAAFLLEGDAHPLLRKGVCQMLDRAIVNAALAMDAVDAGDGCDHARHEPAGGAGFADVHGQGLGCARPGFPADAAHIELAALRLDERAELPKALGGAGQVLTVEHAFKQRLAACQGRADERPVGQGFGRGRGDVDDGFHACSWTMPAP